jgi:hypothetical protein
VDGTLPVCRRNSGCQSHQLYSHTTTSNPGLDCLARCHSGITRRTGPVDLAVDDLHLPKEEKRNTHQPSSSYIDSPVCASLGESNNLRRALRRKVGRSSRSGHPPPPTAPDGTPSGAGGMGGNLPSAQIDRIFEAGPSPTLRGHSRTLLTTDVAFQPLRFGSGDACLRFVFFRLSSQEFRLAATPDMLLARLLFLLVICLRRSSHKEHWRRRT